MDAGAFVGVEILHREPPVVHAACDHNGSRADAFAAGKFQNKGRCVIVRYVASASPIRLRTNVVTTAHVGTGPSVRFT